MLFFVAFFRGRVLFAAFAGIIVRDARDGGKTFRRFDVLRPASRRSRRRFAESVFRGNGFAGSTFFDRQVAEAVVSRVRVCSAIPETLREVDFPPNAGTVSASVPAPVRVERRRFRLFDPFL